MYIPSHNVYGTNLQQTKQTKNVVNTIYYSVNTVILYCDLLRTNAFTSRPRFLQSNFNNQGNKDNSTVRCRLQLSRVTIISIRTNDVFNAPVSQCKCPRPPQ